MSFKNKVAKAWATKKHRTIDIIDAEYNNEALNAGHKAGIAQKLLREVEEHHNRMEQLSRESQVAQGSAAKALATAQEPKNEATLNES